MAWKTGLAAGWLRLGVFGNGVGHVFDLQLHALRFADTEQDMQLKIEYMANAIAENAEL